MCICLVCSFYLIILRSTHVTAFIKNSFLFIAESYTILWMNINLFIHLLVDEHWVASCPWPLQTQPQINLYESLYRHMLSFFLIKYLEVEELGCKVGICLMFKKLANCLYDSIFPTVVYEVLRCCISLPRLGTVSIFNIKEPTLN